MVIHDIWNLVFQFRFKIYRISIVSKILLKAIPCCELLDQMFTYCHALSENSDPLKCAMCISFWKCCVIFHNTNIIIKGNAGTILCFIQLFCYLAHIWHFCTRAAHTMPVAELDTNWCCCSCLYNHESLFGLPKSHSKYFTSKFNDWFKSFHILSLVIAYSLECFPSNTVSSTSVFTRGHFKITVKC